MPVITGNERLELEYRDYLQAPLQPLQVRWGERRGGLGCLLVGEHTAAGAGPTRQQGVQGVQAVGFLGGRGGRAAG